jgi:AbrB family looped-hinge helix DNA binding protein
MAQTTVSSKGQIVLPKAIRDKRRWKAGTKLTVEERPEGVLLRSIDKKRKLTISDLRGIVKYDGPPRSIEEMNAAVDAEFRRRFARGRY